MALPTYPFARERYWISDDIVAQPQPQAEATAQLHPLVAYNSSTLKETSFTSALSDTAFYAVDHAVNGERIFPGAAYLELGCITGHIAGEQRVRKITDVIWMQPLSFRGGPQTVRTTLSATAGGADYAVSSMDDEQETIVHSEGRLTFQSGSAHLVVAEERVALDALKARCAAPEDAATCYARFREHGLQYGPSFQSIQELWVGESFALAKLSIAPHLAADFGQYILHPAIIDGALQTIAGLARATSADTPFVPFALDELDLLRTVPQTCYAYAEAADSRPQSGVMKFNIRLLSERGDVLVKFKNLYVRPLARLVTGGDALVTAASGAKGQLVMLSGDSVR
jgi:acyl transferase domain-containing protein